ncbi:MAG: hypothetical protein HGA97_13105, partial [Chlorobiaceae bacterium]|nr:hypothetical protein [Chlorobiaceae bacterium]
MSTVVSSPGRELFIADASLPDLDTKTVLYTLKGEAVPVNISPVWKDLPVVSALLMAPGQYLSIDLAALATDADGDTVYYYGELGYLNGSEFWQMPEMADILLYATAEGHLVGGATLWDLTLSRDYLLRIHADDNFGDTVPGVYFDVPVTVIAPGNSAPFALVPDTNPSDDLLSTFNPGSMTVGRLYDDDGDLIADRLKLFSYWYDANLEIASETGEYALSWSDGTHWTANRLYAVAFGKEYDADGRPLSLVIEGEPQTIDWQAEVVGGVVATVDMSYKGGDGSAVSAGLNLIDTGTDNQPDRVISTESSDGYLVNTFQADFYGWSYDGLGRPVAASLKVQSALDPADVFEGSIDPGTGGASATIDLPSFVYHEGAASDTLTYATLGIDLGVADAELASTGHVTITAQSYQGMATIDIGVDSLSISGNFLQVPLSGTDTNGHSYAFMFQSGSRVLVQIPDDLVTGYQAIAKAWQVNMTNDGAYWLSLITVVESAGTAGMDWAIGTSGDDLVATGPDNDMIQWSGGDDTIDAGSGNDTLALIAPSMMVSKWFDDTGVLHLGQPSQPSFLDSYRVAKLSDEVYRIEKIAEDGVGVLNTMRLSHAEVISFGSQTIALTLGSLAGSYISGTPWDDLISLNLSSIGNLDNLWGDSGADVLAFDLGAGYSALRISRISGQLHLMGSLEAGGDQLDLAMFSGYTSGYDGSFAFSIGSASQTIWTNEIESFRFTSGSLTFDVDILLLASVTFESGESMNTITGSANADFIDADALGLVYGATTAQDSIIA